MARIIKALTNTEVNNAKAKEKDYKLMDGKAQCVGIDLFIFSPFDNRHFFVIV